MLPFFWSCSQPSSLAWGSATMLCNLQEKALCLSSTQRPAACLFPVSLQPPWFCSGSTWARAHGHAHVNAGMCCDLPVPHSSALSIQPTPWPSSSSWPRVQPLGKCKLALQLCCLLTLQESNMQYMVACKEIKQLLSFTVIDKEPKSQMGSYGMSHISNMWKEAPKILINTTCINLWSTLTLF